MGNAVIFHLSPGRGLPTPTPGCEAKSLKNGIPTLLHMKASTKTNKKVFRTGSK